MKRNEEKAKKWQNEFNRIVIIFTTSFFRFIEFSIDRIFRLLRYNSVGDICMKEIEVDDTEEKKLSRCTQIVLSAGNNNNKNEAILPQMNK